MQSSITQPANLMAFDNNGGIGNGGVCWWHSRFQRNAHYVAFFQPQSSKKENRYYKKLIRQIVKGKRVVKIPGFKNLRQFSLTYKSYIQKQLNKWQLKDGFLKFAWVKGLQGKTEATPLKLKSMMDNLYNLIEKKKNLTYTKLQLKGIVAHAWLVYKVTRNSNGYTLHYIDSNWASIPKKYTYRNGDRSLHVYGNGLLYSEKGKEFNRLKSIVKSYCSN